MLVIIVKIYKLFKCPYYYIVYPGIFQQPKFQYFNCPECDVTVHTPIQVPVNEQ